MGIVIPVSMSIEAEHSMVVVVTSLSSPPPVLVPSMFVETFGCMRLAQSPPMPGPMNSGPTDPCYFLRILASNSEASLHAYLKSIDCIPVCFCYSRARSLRAAMGMEHLSYLPWGPTCPAAVVIPLHSRNLLSSLSGTRLRIPSVAIPFDSPRS